MKIRLKVVVLVGGLFAVLASVQALVQRGVLLPGFEELERESATTDMERTQHVLERELDLLEAMTADWGNWDATYAYMRDRDPKFIADNMTLSAIEGYRAHVVALVDLEGRYVWSTVLPSDPRAAPLDLVARGRLPLTRVWQEALRTGQSFRGLVATNHGPMLAALAPVLDGNGQGPHRGMILLARRLDSTEVARIAEQAHVRISVAPALPSDGVAATLDQSLAVRDDVTEVYRSFRDVNGAPLLNLRIEVPRDISAHGREVIRYASVFTAAAGIAATVLLVLALNQWVLRPLSQVRAHAVAIGHGELRAMPVGLQRSDELGDLAREFNGMIERVADAQRRLVDLSFDAGIAENASGVLHNLGNAMTPLGVNVAHLQQALRGAPTADLDLVLTELAATPQDAERQRGLEEFLRLTSMELGRQLSSALQQVDVVARQVHAIHDVLADQQRLARAGRVTEVVDSCSLLSQSIDLVPPMLRKNLQIVVDDSCEALGRINVARTTLQQVFQNLIVNAAESIRDAGRASGTLRISAQVVAAPTGDQVHWCFDDDGAGIADNDVERIFRKGFSTKSASTNSGIGLHWCANVVTALGGSIRAESAGRDSGARFHVILPLERAA